MKKQFITVFCMTATAASLLFCACTPFQKEPEQKIPPAPTAQPVVKIDIDKVNTAYDKPETKTAFHALSSVKAMKELKSISYKATHAKTKTAFIFELERSGKRKVTAFPTSTQKPVPESGTKIRQESGERFHTLSHFDWEAVAYKISAVPKKERTYLLKVRPQFKWHAGMDVQLTFDTQGRLVKEEVIDQKSKAILFHRENTKFDQAGFPAEFKNIWQGSSDADIWQISEIKKNEPGQVKTKQK